MVAARLFLRQSCAGLLCMLIDLFYSASRVFILWFHLFGILVFSFIFSNMAFGLLPGTKVLLADGQHKMAKDLKKGDLIPVFNLKDKSLEVVPRKIQKIKVKKNK